MPPKTKKADEALVLIGEVDTSWIEKTLLWRHARGHRAIISSGGGDVSVARAVSDMVRHAEILGMGTVASSALMIFVSAKTRMCLPSTMFVHHEPYMVISRDTTQFKSELEESVAQLRMDYDWLGELFEAQTTIPAEKWKSMGSKGGCVLDAEAALNLGLVHEIVPD